jgi:pimeloyl-ACP methyl ester carboxylesterase
MKLHCREMGEGQPVVILHGLFGNSDNWQTHAKKLAEYFRVILVDQRNHGHSDWSEEFSYDLMSADLFELFESLSLKKVILIGHSMGGKTAIQFAQEHPTFVEKLIVIDIGVKQYPMHHAEILKGLHSIDLKVVNTRGEAESILSQFIESYGVRQFLLKNLYWKEKGVLAWRMNIAVLEREMVNILAALSPKDVFLPTLFIRGALSNYILDQDIDDLENQFSDFNLVTIENSGHWVHSESPTEFLNSVLEFCLR